ncbi:hypothetical protein CR513_19119, partial [Mucuna pruriens]
MRFYKKRAALSLILGSECAQAIEHARVGEIRSFIGLVCYYKRSSFLELKKKLRQALVLVLPNSSEPFMMYHDASNMGLEKVLM